MTIVSPADERSGEAAIYDALRPIFVAIFAHDIALSADLRARDVAGWDSFKQIEILIAVERRFGFKFASAEIDAMACLGDLVAIVARRGSKSGTNPKIVVAGPVDGGDRDHADDQATVIV